MCRQRDCRKRLRFPVWYHSGGCDTLRVLSRVLRRVRMSSAKVNVHRWLLTGQARASASARTQASLGFSTNAAQMAQLPISSLGTDWSDTAIHDLDRPSAGECRDGKIGIRAIWTRDKRTTIPLHTCGASTGRFSSTGTPITIRPNPVRSGAGHEHGTRLSGSNGLQIDEIGRPGFGSI